MCLADIQKYKIQVRAFILHPARYFTYPATGIQHNPGWGRKVIKQKTDVFFLCSILENLEDARTSSNNLLRQSFYNDVFVVVHLVHHRRSDRCRAKRPRHLIL